MVLLHGRVVSHYQSMFFECEGIDAEKINYVPSPSDAGVYWKWKYRYKIEAVTGAYIYFDGYRIVNNYMDNEMKSTHLVSALALGQQIN